MGIKIKEIRIRNFRSLKSVDMSFDDICILIGANNVGKTSLLQALQLAFAGTRKFDSEDIYVEAAEILPKERKAIIDVLIVSTDSKNIETATFDDTWFEHFGEFRSEFALDLKQFVALRTVISFDLLKGDYEIERRSLIEWPQSDLMEEYGNYKKSRVTEKVIQAIPVFYMDAKRDIATEMRDKSSYWGKLVADVGLNKEDIDAIENTLDSINETIIDKSAVLKHLVDRLNKITETVSSDKDSIKINPVSRKIRDLNRGIDISFKDQESESFPISSHGMGTRSWITYLTLTAYITWKTEQMKVESLPYHPFILLEEPESHLHPQAQRHIFKQMNDMSGQKIISTHSPVIVGQADISTVRQIYKEKGCSNVHFIDMTAFEKDKKQLQRIRQEIFKTRGDLLFARALILCEGETEELAIPMFFKKYYGFDCFEVGINIIGVGGSGKYFPFLKIAKDFNIKYFIFSDGEPQTRKKINKDLKEIYGDSTSVESSKHVVMLERGRNFEEYLIDSGYEKELIQAIEEVKGAGYFTEFIRKNDKTSNGSKPTSSLCNTCKQNIYMTELRDYTGTEGEKKALLDCLTDIKTEYASVIATFITRRTKGQFPPKIIELFESITKTIGIKKYVKDVK